MIKVITTVGTSLFTNYMRKEVQDDYLAKNNKQNYDISKSYKVLLKEQGGRVKNSVKTAVETHWIKDILQSKNNDGDLEYKYKANYLNIHCCAEVQTIESIRDEIISNLKKKDQTCEMILLTTDTQLSKLAAEIIQKQVYNKPAETREPIVITGLDVTNSEIFNDDGFKNLFDEVVKIKGENKDDTLILNISGGYKGIIPIMTLIGQLLDINIVYMYENSNKLIQITKLPINFDTTLLEGAASYMDDDYLKTIDNQSNLYTFFDKYKLLKTENDITKMSGVGKVLHAALFKGNMSNTILGTFIEYKLFHYFITSSSNEKEIYYNPIMIDDSKCFKIDNNQYLFQDIPLNNKGNEQIPNGFTRLGDLDIVLNEKKRGIDVICEVKSHFQVVNDFHEHIGKEKDYYKKIKARIEYWLSEKPNNPFTFLFIIHKIKILEGDKSSIGDDKINKVIEYFSTQIAKEYPSLVSFEVRGVWIDTRKKELLVNYTNLFRKPILFDDWVFLLPTVKI